MRKAILAIILIFSCCAFAKDRKAESGYDVTCQGSSFTGIKHGMHLVMVLTADEVRFTQKDASLLAIPVSALTSFRYVPEGHFRFYSVTLPRYAESTKHFVEIKWTVGDQRDEILVRCDKDQIEDILDALRSYKKGG